MSWPERAEMPYAVVSCLNRVKVCDLAEGRSRGSRSREEESVNRSIVFLLSAFLLAFPIAPSDAGAQESTLLAVAYDPAVGAFLTDAEGMTLYLFTPDTEPGVSACYDDCAEAWPPL